MALKLNQVCSICGGSFIGKGFNSQPLEIGRCCNTCNFEKVLPFKIMFLVNKEKRENERISNKK